MAKTPKHKAKHHTAEHGDQDHLRGVYHVVVHGPDGEKLHEEQFHNLVTTQGKNAMLDTFLGRGTAYAGIYMSLITSATAPVAGDTYASHGFSEATSAQMGSTRPAVTYNAASGGSKASTSTSFSIAGGSNVTVYGILQVMGPTGTSTTADTATLNAILYSAGTFSGGSITVPSGSTLTATYTGSL